MIVALLIEGRPGAVAARLVQRWLWSRAYPPHRVGWRVAMRLWARLERARVRQER